MVTFTIINNLIKFRKVTPICCVLLFNLSIKRCPLLKILLLFSFLFCFILRPEIKLQFSGLTFPACIDFKLKDVKFNFMNFSHFYQNKQIGV